MKSKQFLITTFFALSTTIAAEAQRFNYTPPPVNFNQMNFQMQMMMMANFSRRFDYVSNPKRDYLVTFKDGTIKTVHSKILPDTAAHKNYLLLVDKSYPKSDPKREQKVYPDETLSIARIEEDYDLKDTLEARANDSCWLFRAVYGKIKAYSFLLQKEDLNTLYLNAFQFEDGPIQKLIPSDLESILKTDEKAYKYFLKKDYYEAIVRYNKDHQ